MMIIVRCRPWIVLTAFFSNYRHPDGFIDVVACDNTHFVVVLAVILTRHVRLTWGLISGRRRLWFIIMNKHLPLMNAR